MLIFFILDIDMIYHKSHYLMFNDYLLNEIFKMFWFIILYSFPFKCVSE